MIIIGNQGATAERSAHTLAGIREYKKHGVAMLTLSVRLTRDKKLVLLSDTTLDRTHKLPLRVKACTLKELQKRTSGSRNPICTLDEALKTALPNSIVVIELKDSGAGLKVLELLTNIAHREHKDNVMLASSSIRELKRVRGLHKKIKLCMIMKSNPFSFVAWEKTIGFTAVAFHRLHLNSLAISTAHKLDIFTYTYTVNRQSAIDSLARQKLDAIVTDYPLKMNASLKSDTQSK